jgi:hypothetical protein
MQTKIVAGSRIKFFQQHQKRHARAVQDPQPGFERALLNMIRGFLEYAETHAGTLNNHVLGEALKRTGLKSLYEI